MAHKLIVGVALMWLLSGCQSGEIDRLNKELETARAEAALARKACDTSASELKAKEAELVNAQSMVAKLQAENTKLKQTAKYFFDAAVAKVADPGTNASDETAIKAFQVVVDRFPSDPLARDAASRIARLEERIDSRDKLAEQLEGRLRGFVRQCAAKARAAKQARDSDSPASAKQAASLDEAVQDAKRKATALLEGGELPDPDGSLHSSVRTCDALQ